MQRAAALLLVLATATTACGDDVVAAATGDAATTATAPATLRETGLYTLPVQTFAPQYPLWTDGAAKQRWIYLPPGTTIDASKTDAWELPIGTRLWKEFAFAGTPVETRYLERTASGWLFATYVPTPGTDARDAALVIDGAQVPVAPGRTHAVPRVRECNACHGSAPTPVLGFTALQLSTDRDQNAIHGTPAGALDLAALVAQGRLRNAATDLVANPPRIAARTPAERAVLGYLHGNCGHCHNATGPLAGLDLVLAAGTQTVATTVGHPSHFRPAAFPDATALRVVPGAPQTSVLVARMRARDPITQMPPLGTQLTDDEAVQLVATWIAALNPTEN